MSMVPQTANSQDGAENSSAARRSHSGEMMMKVVPLKVNSSYNSQAKSPPLSSQSAGLSNMTMLCVGGRESCGAAVLSGVTPPIVQSNSTLSADGGASKNPKPIKVISLYHSPSHGRESEAGGSLSFQKGQGRTATSRSRKCSANTISGRWTAAEHETFLQGLKVYGREWKKVANCIPTRSSAQIRSHAQKYFTKLSKEIALSEERRSSFPDAMPTKSVDEYSILQDDQPMSSSFISTMNSITKNPSEVETRVCKTLASLRERYRQLEDRLRQVQSSKSLGPPVQSEEAAIGPASAALEIEQKSLRKAAKARYELKRLETKLERKPPSTVEETNASFPCVSLASMPSHGGFDSSDVIALSMLGGSLQREKIENETISTIKDGNSLKLVRAKLQLFSKVDQH